jgi:hypothetical protein
MMVPQYSFSRRPDATASCQVFTNILPIFPFVCSLCSTVTVAILLLKRVEFLNMFLGGNTPLKRTRSSRPSNMTKRTVRRIGGNRHLRDDYVIVAEVIAEVSLATPAIQAVQDS